MNNRIINNQNELIEKGRNIISDSVDANYQHKVELVLLVLQGFKVSDFSRLKIVSKSALTSWVRDVVNSGSFECLRHLPITGRPKRLSDEQLEELKKALQSDPEEYGYLVWDGKTIQEYISSKFNQNICIRHCQRIKNTLTKKWGKT